ncbi:MAG: S8 family serine peptidase, partial [Alphaproteobacteria bacterium]
ISIAPSGTLSSQLAFWKYIANAVNYAASKNAVIVFAAGNNAQALAAGGNVTGFSDAALARMIIVGSTNAKKQLSSFSDKPGSSHFVSTSGKNVSYESMWVVADGENIYGASRVKTSTGYNGLAIYTGTSMAAPQAAGAAGLLAAKWPFLLSQGTIPQILETTAQDLGSAGADTSYGKGFLRVDIAMQPVGGQYVPVASGASVKVSSSGGGQIASGASFGNMPALASALSKAVSYDSFMRGFPLFNGKAVITSASLLPESPATLLAMGEIGASARQMTRLGDHEWFTFSGAPTATDAGIAGDNQQLGFALDPTRTTGADWSYGLMRSGTYIGMGQGADAQLSFSDARWGGDSAFFNADASAASALIATVPHAQFATMGFALSGNSRIAASVISQSAEVYGNVRGVDSSAVGGAIAYTMRPAASWMVSMTSSFLSENNLLLGSRAYGNVLGVAPSPLSASFGVGTNIDLGHGYQIGFDATYATTDAAENPLSLIGRTSRLESDSFSFAFAKSNLTGANDTLHVTVSQPLRVIAGAATLTVPVGTDDNAQPIIQTERVSL